MSEHVKQLPEYHNLTAETADIFRSLEARLAASSKASADRIKTLEAELVRTFNNMMRDADRIEKLEAALRELSTDWDCCNVSKAMRAIARQALEVEDDPQTNL